MKSSLILPILAPLVAGQATFYGFIWKTGANITSLESTMVLPPVPNPDTGFHALWPGMEPTAQNFVFQNVVDDDQPDGTWAYSVWYGPYDSAGDYYDYPTTAVSEGDSIYSLFTFDTSSYKWNDAWDISGEQSSNGAIQNTFSFVGGLTEALFIIELQGGAVWSFGQLEFQNIKITSETSDSSWCSSPSQINTFTYSMSTPEASSSGGFSSCFIESLILLEPTGSSDAVASGTIEKVVKQPVRS